MGFRKRPPRLAVSSAPGAPFQEEADIFLFLSLKMLEWGHNPAEKKVPRQC